MLGVFTLLWADVINVPGNYGTIQEAISAANPGDVINVAN